MQWRKRKTTEKRRLWKESFVVNGGPLLSHSGNKPRRGPHHASCSHSSRPSLFCVVSSSTV
eukprot:5781425-Pyramimonas_sp.AAC.1